MLKVTIPDDPNEPDFEWVIEGNRTLVVCLCGNRMLLQCPGMVKCGKCGRERRYRAVDHVQI